MPNVLLCIPLYYISEVERGILTTGQPRISIHFAQAHALKRSSNRNNMGESFKLTMCPGLSNDLQKFDDTRKTAIISRELKRLNIDIAALQETRLPSNSRLGEKDYIFVWQEKGPEEHCVHGVAFTERHSLPSSG
ncbi:hypothetical protein PoB_003545200 [Plakobranchus ocellatus]|uniref:Endonuclease/exonuclease/phosphatase domain-containing protein n=1 Tax=Plakobranchus ocellatus TaxID=259542 RepID=A0AAV4ANV1_9GAST|nr:hypothetical protein PoB_003545200 [Plakobranchus ocellatus]